MAGGSSFIPLGLPPGSQIGPPRGIPPTRPQPLRRVARTAEDNTSGGDSLQLDPFNLSAQSGMSDFDQFTPF
jgi:hypothetical protein